MVLIFSTYVFTLLSCYLSTTFLIICKQSWGALPRLYIHLIERWQDCLSLNKEMGVDNNNGGGGICIGRKHLTPDIRDKEHLSSPFKMSTHLLCSGIESILQDDISRPFLEAPQHGWWMLASPPVYSGNGRIQYPLVALYSAGLIFRWGFLLPLRLLFLITCLVWVFACGILCFAVDLPPKLRLYMGITFARLFNASTGLVIRVHDTQNRPRAPGIAVANHMTANDIMTIYSDVPYDGVGYTATGQSHGGLIASLQNMGGRLTPTLWLNREDQQQRANFQKQVIDYSSNPSVYPVLLFPEGYCSNNDTVLQFRKAVFTGEVPIYPIAMLQNQRVGDAFWREDTYLPYLLRIMTSWALQYDIAYLPPMVKRDSEDSAAFASRVQSAIARSIGREALPYDGGLKRADHRAKYRVKIQDAIRAIIG